MPASSLEPRWHQGLRQGEATKEIDIHDVSVVFQRGRGTQATEAHATVVHQDINAAKLLQGPLGALGELICLGSGKVVSCLLSSVP